MALLADASCDGFIKPGLTIESIRYQEANRFGHGARIHAGNQLLTLDTPE
jgi:hypothetical protein